MENCEEHPRSNLVQKWNVHRSQEDYITQVSEESDEKVTKKLSQGFSRRENRILGAFSRLDDILMNSLIQGHSGTAPETSRSTYSSNHGANVDDPQSDLLPEASIFHKQATRSSGPEDDHDMVTGVHEEVIYCSHSTTSRKQKKNRSTSQQQFRSENTPATIELDHVLLALQQLANNKISSNLHNSINRVSKVPKSLTTTMPTFDGKSEKFEFFEDLSQTSLKIHNQLTEDDRINYIYSLMSGDALQTFKNINGPTRKNRGRNFGRLPKEVRETPIDGDSETWIPETCIQSSESKVSRLSWRTSKYGQRRSQNSCPCHHRAINIRQNATTREEIRKSGPFGERHIWANCVTHLGKQLELNVLEAPDELQLNTVSQKAANTNANRPKLTCHHCKKPELYGNQCRWLKRQQKETGNTQNFPGNKKVAPVTLSQVTIPTTITTTTTKTVTELKESRKLFIHPVRHVGR